MLFELLAPRPGRIYLHVFDWRRGELALNGLNNKVLAAHLLSSGAALKFKDTDDKIFHSLRTDVPTSAPSSRME